MAPFEIAVPKWFARISKARLWGGIVCALIFLLLGCIFVDYAGVQTDEALFAGSLFRSWRFFSVPLGHYDLPLMNMPYNGALKLWLYAPVFRLWQPAAGSIRVPAILLGAATIVIFWGLLIRVHSRAAAWAGCILLATDTSFLLMTTYDWGPVALQHLLLVAAMFFAVRWFQTVSDSSLVAAALCCGLALWDKAVFIWVFTAILFGSLVFGAGIRRRLTWRRAAIGTTALCVGALPLIVYNLAAEQKFATVRTVDLSSQSSEVPQRLQELRATGNGSVLFGYLVYEDDVAQPKSPRSRLERASFTLRGLAGEHRRNHMLFAICAALLLLPLLWRTRARKVMLFSLIAVVVAWIYMVRTGGGGGPHHAVLLWPLPHLFLAAAFAETSLHLRFGKWALAAVVGFLALDNTLVTNQYLYQFIRNGAPGAWTDAVFPLADDLKRSHASQIILPDWGLVDSLCVLNRDSPLTHPVDDPFLAPGHSPDQKQDDLKVLSDAKAIWVVHTPGNESSPGVNDRVLGAARRAGFRPVMLKTYSDSHGRPMFQTLQFALFH
jgi:hypothetical protein